MKGYRNRIDIVIAPADAQAIVNRTSERVRCTFTFDGVVLEDVGVRQAGGTFYRFVPIDYDGFTLNTNNAYLDAHLGDAA